MNSRPALPQYSRREPPLKTSSKRFSRFSTVPRWANVPLDPDVAELQALAETGAPALSDGTVEQKRSNYFRTPTPPPDEIAHVVDSLVDGLTDQFRFASTPRQRSQQIFLSLSCFTGSWVPSVDGQTTSRRLAVVTDALIVSVDYRLAPEHPFPQPHDDCWAVTQWSAHRQRRSVEIHPARHLWRLGWRKSCCRCRTSLAMGGFASVPKFSAIRASIPNKTPTRR